PATTTETSTKLAAAVGRNPLLRPLSKATPCARCIRRGRNGAIKRLRPTSFADRPTLASGVPGTTTETSTKLAAAVGRNPFIAPLSKATPCARCIRRGRNGAIKRLRPTSCGSGFGLRGHALVLEQRLQLTGLEHLAHDIAAAHELAFDVELRDGRPIGVALDA